MFSSIWWSRFVILKLPRFSLHWIKSLTAPLHRKITYQLCYDRNNIPTPINACHKWAIILFVVFYIWIIYLFLHILSLAWNLKGQIITTEQCSLLKAMPFDICESTRRNTMHQRSMYTTFFSKLAFFLHSKTSSTNMFINRTGASELIPRHLS